MKLICSFPFLFAAFVSIASAQALRTIPEQPVAGYGFHLVATVPASGRQTEPMEFTHGGGELHVYLGHTCSSPCPPPEPLTRTLWLDGVPPGSYEVFVHEFPRSTNPPAIARGSIVIAAANTAVVTTNIGEPTAFTPFTATVRAMFPSFMWGRPEVHVDGTAITVYMRGSCGFLCATPGLASASFDLPALRPGTYDLAVHPGDPPSPHRSPAVARLVVPAPMNFQGLWWGSPAGSESGWGLQIAHQEETLFVTWYTYDTDRNPTWFVMSSARRLAAKRYGGTLYRATAAPSQASWQLAPSTQVTAVGSAILEFSGPNEGSFWYMVGDKSDVKSITRQVFASPLPTCRSDDTAGASPTYQDLWWQSPAGSAPGWGLQMAHQGNNLFVTVYGYDNQGQPRWIVIPDAVRMEGGRYSGMHYTTKGPPFHAVPWRASEVEVTLGGVAELRFSGANEATLRTFGRSNQPLDQVAVTRQIFAPYPTICR